MCSKKVVTVMYMLVLVVALAAGCGKKGDELTETVGPKDAKYVIGMSQCNKGEPWRVRMNDDIKKAALAKGDIRVILKDAQNRSETQQSQVREFIQQGVDLIIISPKEAQPLTRPVEEAMDAGIPVIVLDRKIESDKYTCFIGADNVKIGREAGKFIVDKLGGEGNVVELKGLMTSTPGKERHQGFREAIEGTDVKVVAEHDMEWIETKAQEKMNAALTALKADGITIGAVYAHNDPGAHGAYLVVKRDPDIDEKEVIFVGIDASPDEGIRYVKEGILAATFDYPTGGAEAIDTAVKKLNGEEVPKKITLGTRIFTKDNVDEGGEAIE